MRWILGLIAALSALAWALFPGEVRVALAVAGGPLELPVARVLPAGGPAERPLAEALRENPECVRNLRVFKADRRLEARCGDVVLKRYVVNLGFDPVGQKTREGDGKTPEGDLIVCSSNDRSQFHHFLGLSYPRTSDAAGADEKTRAAIARAEKRGTCPPWGTGLGGAVGIHGNGWWVRSGDTIKLHDWTLGCVAVTDADIDELKVFAKVGTRVRIEP